MLLSCFEVTHPILISLPSANVIQTEGSCFRGPCPCWLRVCSSWLKAVTAPNSVLARPSPAPSPQREAASWTACLYNVEKEVEAEDKPESLPPPPPPSSHIPRVVGAKQESTELQFQSTHWNKWKPTGLELGGGRRRNFSSEGFFFFFLYKMLIMGWTQKECAFLRWIS